MTDEEIIALFWQRSETAIAETSNLYGRYFHSVAFSILRNEEDAKETVNDTYLKAWNSIPPQRPNHLKAFLGRITRQLSINRLECSTAQKRAGSQYQLALDELSECISDKSTDSVEEISLKNALNSFLAALSREKRIIFMQRYWYLSSVKDIARHRGISENSVKITLMRLRIKLKKHLEKEGVTL